MPNEDDTETDINRGPQADAVRDIIERKRREHQAPTDYRILKPLQRLDESDDAFRARVVSAKLDNATTRPGVKMYGETVCVSAQVSPGRAQCYTITVTDEHGESSTFEHNVGMLVRTADQAITHYISTVKNNAANSPFAPIVWPERFKDAGAKSRDHELLEMGLRVHGADEVGPFPKAETAGDVKVDPDVELPEQSRPWLGPSRRPGEELDTSWRETMLVGELVKVTATRSLVTNFEFHIVVTAPGGDESCTVDVPNEENGSVPTAEQALDQFIGSQMFKPTHRENIREQDQPLSDLLVQEERDRVRSTLADLSLDQPIAEPVQVASIDWTVSPEPDVDPPLGDTQKILRPDVPTCGLCNKRVTSENTLAQVRALPGHKYSTQFLRVALFTYLGGLALCVLAHSFGLAGYVADPVTGSVSQTTQLTQLPLNVWLSSLTALGPNPQHTSLLLVVLAVLLQLRSGPFMCDTCRVEVR